MKRIIIIGAGPGGLCAGKRLKDIGYDDFLILEQAPELGGTWWHNRYPGCRCDVPSSLYSFSFAQKTDWTEPYATQPEILAYLKDCAEKFELRPHLRLNTTVESASWDDSAACWTVTTSKHGVLTADILISAIGLFNEPAYPTIEGLAQFSGDVMHSARWNHEVDLTGKRVGVIGSAASAVQLVPEIAKIVAHLAVFQRTPNYVGPRDHEFSREFIEHARLDAQAAVIAERARIAAWLDSVCTLDQPAVMSEMAAACAKNLEQVFNPVTQRGLAPNYPFGSKRVLVSNEWYPAFNRDNVVLVTDPIACIGSNAIVTKDGAEYPVDVIVLATGFETTRFLSAIPVTGRGGLALDAAWNDGAQAYLGITTHGFPNLFMLYGPNTNNGSIISQLECQVDYILRKLQTMERNALRWIDIKADAQRIYNDALQADLAEVAVWHAGTNDYYRAASGRIVTQWPHSMARYRRETSRDDDDAYETSETPAETPGSGLES